MFGISSNIMSLTGIALAIGVVALDTGAYRVARVIAVVAVEKSWNRTTQDTVPQ